MKFILICSTILFFSNLNAQSFFFSPNIGYNFYSRSMSYLKIDNIENTMRYKLYRFNLSQGKYYNIETGYEFENHLVSSLTFSIFDGEESIKDEFKEIQTVNVSISSKTLMISPRLYYKSNLFNLKPMFGLGIPIFKSTIIFNNKLTDYKDEYSGEWQFGTEVFGGIEYSVTNNISITMKVNYTNLRFTSNNKKEYLHGEKVSETNLKDSEEWEYNSKIVFKELSHDFNLSTFGSSLGVNVYF